MTTLARLLLLAACSTTAFSQAPGHLSVLTGIEKTEHLDVRFRPGSRAAAGVDRIAWTVERDLEDICRQLDFVPKKRLVLCIYDDVKELHRVTGTTGNAGFSAGDTSHVPFDNDQTRYHELVHIVAYLLPAAGKERRNLFFAEGLANALLRFVHGVHVHAVAAFELREKTLPPLDEMTGAPDFYAWLRAHPGFNGYDVGASWMRFLIDAHGIDDVKRYYTGVPARRAFGRKLARLERDWHAMLEKFRLRPEVAELLRARRGGVTPRAQRESVPEAVLGKPGDWRDMVKAKFAADDDAAWRRSAEGLHGKSATADWQACRLGDEGYGDMALAAVVRPGKGTVGVQVRLGPKRQAMITNAGAFLYADGVVAASPADPLGDRERVELLVERRGASVKFYIDGKKVLEATMADAEARPAIGVAGGTAIFESVRLRPLPE